MRISRASLAALILSAFSILPLSAQLKYERGGMKYELFQSGESYIVKCRFGPNTSSRTLSAAADRARLVAKDLVGASILYGDFSAANKLDESYFQIFVDCVSLKYSAEISDFTRTYDRTADGELVFECPKSSYTITAATYNAVSDFADLLTRNYSLRKDSNSASLLYNYGNVPVMKSLEICRDFLTGKVQLTEAFRTLQSYNDRMDESVYGEETKTLRTLVKFAVASVDKKMPFGQLCYIEIISAASLKDKPSYYTEWTSTLSKDILAEKILIFCAKNCRTSLPTDNPTMSEIITAFPGAISPYALRRGSDADYQRAAVQYSRLNFTGAIEILQESIDLNGISPKTLCLLGASHRLNGSPEKAMPYLLLCAYLDPNTEYLAGNMALCLNALGFKDLKTLLEAADKSKMDLWSCRQIETLLQ